MHHLPHNKRALDTPYKISDPFSFLDRCERLIVWKSQRILNRGPLHVQGSGELAAVLLAFLRQWMRRFHGGPRAPKDVYLEHIRTAARFLPMSLWLQERF